MTITRLTDTDKYKLQQAIDLWHYNGIIMDGFTLDENSEIWFARDYDNV